MKTTRCPAQIISRPAACLILAATLGCGLAGTLLAADLAADTKKTEPAPKKLTGAELYAINCNRCHQERYPTEFNSAQWQTLITHMRVRANLPSKQAKEILKYLKEEAGS